MLNLFFPIIAFFFFKGYKDLKWFSPSFFLYIATIIPPTWFLELENIRLKRNALETLEGITMPTNASSELYINDFFRKEPTTFTKTKSSNQDVFYDFYDGALPILPSDIKVSTKKFYFEHLIFYFSCFKFKAALSGAHHNFAMYIEVNNSESFKRF